MQVFCIPIPPSIECYPSRILELRDVTPIGTSKTSGGMCPSASCYYKKSAVGIRSILSGPSGIIC